MGGRAEKTALYDAFTMAAKALASGRRAELVDVLAQGERSVEEAAGQIGQSVANTSRHLQVLAQAGLVLPRREGNRVLYRLAGPAVDELWAGLRTVAVEHVAGLDRLAAAYLGDRSGLDQLTRKELARRLGRPDTWCGMCDRPPSTWRDMYRGGVGSAR